MSPTHGPMHAADLLTQDALARAACGTPLSRELVAPADGDLSVDGCIGRLLTAVDQGPVPADLVERHGFPTACVYEVMHRFANPRGGDGVLTHEQYAFIVLVVPGLAAQYREELEGSGTLPNQRYGKRVMLPAAAVAAAGAAQDGHAGRSCGHAHAGAALGGPIQKKRFES